MLSAIPPKMAALFALASILCHVVALGLLVQTRVELSTVRGAADAPRSLLESSDADALAAVRAQLEGVRDELEAMRVDKLRSDERVGLLSSSVERLDEELQATRKGERTRGPEAEAEQVLNATHRQMQQGAAGSCDASGVCTARIITRTVVMQPAMSGRLLV